MAKSIRAKSKKRARAAQRGTVGKKQSNKVLRKTTRRVYTAALKEAHDDSAVADLKSLLSGAGGASAGLVTAEPLKKKKLRYTFNTELRKQRLDHALEDETDDEAEDAAESDDDEMGDAAGDAGAGAAAAAPVEWSGVKMAAGKPLPKRKMSTRYYEWENKALAQPHSAGLYEQTHSQTRKKKNTRSAKNKQPTDGRYRLWES